MAKQQKINKEILRCEYMKLTPDAYAPDPDMQARLSPCEFVCDMHRYVTKYLESEGLIIPMGEDKVANTRKASVYCVLLTDGLLKQIDALPPVFRGVVFEFSDHEHARDLLGDCIEDAKGTLNPPLTQKEINRIWNSIKCAYGSKYSPPDEAMKSRHAPVSHRHK